MSLSQWSQVAHEWPFLGAEHNARLQATKRSAGHGTSACRDQPIAVVPVALLAHMFEHQRMINSGLVIRRAKASDAHTPASIHIAAWHEAYTDLLPSEMLSGLDVADRAERWERILASFSQENSGATFLAVEPNGAKGFVSVSRQREQEFADRGYSAEITSMYVLETAQRRGIGRALFREAAVHLRGAGHSAAALWVLEGNTKARRFYEALGASPIAERQEVRPQTVLNEVAYGWNDLSALSG